MGYYSFNRPRRDGRLSWPCWLTDSGRLTHKVVTRPAIISLARVRQKDDAQLSDFYAFLCSAETASVERRTVALCTCEMHINSSQVSRLCSPNQLQMLTTPVADVTLIWSFINNRPSTCIGLRPWLHVK